VRYLGNKTKLLPAIEAVLRDRGVRPPGVFLDIFSGSNAVGRRMKRLGFSVIANDHLVCSATQARATIALDRSPRFAGVLARPEVRAFLASGEGRQAVLATAPPEGALPDEVEAAAPLREVIAYLNRAAVAVEGLIFRQYSAGGPADRGFFTADVGRAIDGVRATIALWRREGSLAAREEPVLLASLLDAVDRCANISGTYGAFLKKWQANSRGPLHLRAPLVIPGPRSESFCQDANALVGEVDAQVLYLDPPYNRRQYAKNYHVLEVIAELAAVEDEAAYEAGIYGRTGLRDFEDRKSAYCMGSVRGAPSPCEQAFADLVRNARAEHILISYNEEGILSREALARILGQACPGFDVSRDFVEVSHKRFRSDKDEAARRQYRVLENRKKDEVKEWLIYARKPEVSLQALRARRVRTPAAAVRPVS
jgi:adenine-specific DNA-methyltransferase